MKLIKLLISEITDNLIRENFKRLNDFIVGDILRKGNFKFFTYTVVEQPTTSYPLTLSIIHNLGFQPKDIIQLSVSNPDSATVTWNYDDFSMTHVNFTVSAACTVRVFLGRYEDNQ